MTTQRRFLNMTSTHWLRVGGALVGLAAILALVVPLRAALGDYDMSQEPLYTKKSQPPLMMMVMSRDEQLFNKAYSDYSDLDDDKVLDTTYKDSFAYGGYFDSNLCYQSTSGVFKASAKAGGANGHTCSGQWSGNFMNWVTMSRLDVMRSVLYGGQRMTDSLTKTVIERAQIPNDLHAWVKVYAGTDIGNFTPLSGTQSFCNATTSANGVPQMLVASGAWTEWASTSLNQCGTNRSGGDVPGSATSHTVRVEVCASSDANLRESFCRKYNDGTTDRYKPVGVLQNYGESGRLRFGLITGTWANPRDGGVLRRNIGKIAGNGTAFCATGDEIDLSTGQFCYLKTGATANAEGVINTISAFKIDQWNWNNNWNDCNDYSILNRQGTKTLTDPGSGTQKCSAWGNPLAEMYAEALRYVAADRKRYGDTGDLSGLPTGIAWKDPYRLPADGGNSYCANCNILVMSSGLPSFDSDNIGAVTPLLAAAASTDAIGAAEGMNGKTYMAGRIGETPRYESLNTHEDICQGRTVNNLSLVRGICPDIPSMEGSYLMAGLAKSAAETDMRPGVQGKPGGYKVTATTYTVAMAENLPTFEVNVAGAKIGLSPLCQANNTGSAAITSTGWRSCFLGAVGIGTKQSRVSPNYVYGRPYKADGTAGSFSLVWEDSLWGNDHDNDVVAMMSYCVGASCSETGTFNNICWRADATKSLSAANGTRVCNTNGTINGTVGNDEVMIRIENMSAYAGNAMLTGYTISGSNAANSVQRLTLRAGNQDGSVLSATANPDSRWQAPIVMKYKASGGAAGQLESPLWYAAKYGVPAGKKWDSKVAGVPDNYFLARNPAKLKEALESIFDSVAEGNAPVGGGGSGARISTGSFTVSSHFTVPEGSYDWTGDVIATKVGADGADAGELWKASSRIGTGTRNIFMATAPTATAANGTVTAVSAANFTAANLPGQTPAQKLAVLGFSDSIPAWFTGKSPDNLVSYLRGSAVTGLRTRSSPLGDIVNSSTEIVSRRDSFGFTSWSSSATTWKATLGGSYKTYLDTKNGNGGPPTMVYVGANDGMLHAFNGSDSAAAGKEEFAFIPSASLQHIGELANPKYGHRYYVDGPITSSDVYYGGGWHTVLVGTTGAGGATKAPNATAIGNGSVYALDVGNPTGFGASNVLWEVSGKTESDLGFVLGKPLVVPVTGTTANGAPRFVALFGNGVNSTSGKAVLYVVDIQTGKVLKRLSPTGTGYANRNGLINITGVSVRNGDRVTDTVYGGDMQGNLWKFDLSDTNPANWNVALNGVPLFTAEREGARQPITGGIRVAAGPAGGYNVYFGTGQYFAADDNQVSSSSPVQSFYGVWDNLSTAIGGRNNLIQQTITVGTSSSGYQVRDVTRNPVSYTTSRGWYVDLIVGNDVAGERFVGTPTIQSGSVLFATYVPGTSICGTGGGANWLYGLNLLSGGGAMSGLSTSIGGDQVCTENCGGISLTKGGVSANGPPVLGVSGFATSKKDGADKCDPASDPTCDTDKKINEEKCSYVVRAPGADPLYLPRPCGRQSWRQIR